MMSIRPYEKDEWKITKYSRIGIVLSRNSLEDGDEKDRTRRILVVDSGDRMVDLERDGMIVWGGGKTNWQMSAAGTRTHTQYNIV